MKTVINMQSVRHSLQSDILNQHVRVMSLRPYDCVRYNNRA
jgi:hypothetical protein